MTSGAEAPTTVIARLNREYTLAAAKNSVSWFLPPAFHLPGDALPP